MGERSGFLWLAAGFIFMLLSFVAPSTRGRARMATAVAAALCVVVGASLLIQN
jgi:hypothetical protein